MAHARDDKPTLTAEEGRESLRAHVHDKAVAARQRYGPQIDLDALDCMLEDRAIVRYPTTWMFDRAALEPGEFAHAVPNGARPADGFCIAVHPHFQTQPEVVPLVIAYHLVRVNYGDIVSHEEAECFGATLLGFEVDDYYDRLCHLADSIPPG